MAAWCSSAMTSMTDLHSHTSFSTFTHPRPAPSPPFISSKYSESSIQKFTSESCISVKGLRLYSDDGTYDQDISQRVVRTGYVGVQRDKLRSWSWTRRLWVVLEPERLHICQQKNSDSIQTLLLNNVRLIDLVQGRKFCLVIATSSITLYLLFKNIISLHAWYCDIRMRCPLMHISRPTDFQHVMHVAHDAAAGEIKGLPEAWIETLSSWGMGPSMSHTYTRLQPEIASPMTEPQISPVLVYPNQPVDPDDDARPAAPMASVLPPVLGRNRSASAAAAPSIAPSIPVSVDQFRRSPNRFRDLDARNLTGAVQPVNLLPTSRSENCDIWKAEWTGSFGKRKVAIQVIRLQDIVSEDEKNHLTSIVLREVKALHQLRHANVVRVRGFCRDQGPLPGLVSTWLRRGNLMKYLEYQRPSVGKGPRLKFITEVAAGLNYLHSFSQTVLHGNLCGTHILISDHGNVCISGFGLNPILQEMGGHSEDGEIYDPLVTAPTQPSPRWAAMEVIRKGRRHVTSYSDVFSFARTVVEIMTGKDPFHYILDDVEVIHTVLRGVLPRRPSVFGEDDGLWQFLERCWLEEPTMRPTMALALLKMEGISSLYIDTEKKLLQPPAST